MSVTSANTTNLQSYVDGASSSRVALADSLNTTSAKANEVISGCGFGGSSVHSLTGLTNLIGDMQQNESFVALVRQALIEADRYGGDGSVSDSTIEASLNHYGLAVRPGVVEVPEMELYGLVPTSGFVDDPICAANGNFVHGDQDLGFPGFARLLDVDRMYNSLAHGRRGSFGPGWSSILDQRLVVRDGHGVELHLADGAVVAFAPDEAGGFAPNRRRRLSLLAVDDGWVVSRGATDSWTFDAEGTLVRMRSLAAEATVARSDDRIEIAEARSGRWVRYLVAGGSVVAVEASDGRRCTYHYVAGHLSRVERVVGDLTYEVVDGLLRSMTDADGVTLFTNRYDTRGVVEAQVDGHGRTTRYAYEARGVTVISGGDGEPENRMVHDRRGNLVAMIDGLGESMRIDYDQWGNRVKVVDRCWATTRYAYDEGGNVTERHDPDGLGHRWRWDALERLVDEVDRAGHRTAYTYDGDGRSPTEVELPDGTRITSTYDDAGLPLSITDADGVTTSFEWDRDGQLTSVEDATGGRTTFTYDDAGVPVGATNPSGVFAELRLDDSGRVVELRTADGTETFSYSPAGRPTEGSTASGERWTATYGRTGSVQTVVDGSGAGVEMAYDPMGQIVSVTTADGARYEHEYDPVGRVVAMIDPEGNRSSIGYDREGRPVRLEDPTGRVWSRELDQLGRTTVMIDPSGARSTRTYHANGEVASITTPTGGTWTRDIDAQGRAIRLLDPSGGSTTYAYSPAGRTVEVRSPLGRVERRRHDAAGRLAAMERLDGQEVILDRREDGKVVSVLDDIGRTAIGYDAAGRVRSVVGPGVHHRVDRDHGRVTSVASGASAATFEWDPRGLLATVADPAAVVTELTHDARGRVERTVTGWSEQRFGYDGSGWLDHVVDPHGAVTQLTHDAAGLVSEVTFPDRRSLRFERGDHAAPDAIFGPGGVELVRFRHSADGRVEQATAGSVTTRVRRDVHGRIESVDDAVGLHRYRWDADGRLIERQDPDGAHTRFERGPDGSVSRFLIDGRAVEGPSRSVDDTERDAVGRILVDDEGRAYSYDAAGRLAASVDPDDRRSTYHYDERGLLAAEEGDAGTRRFVHGPAGELRQQLHPDGATVAYVHDAVGRRVAEEADDGSRVDYGWDDLDRLVSVRRTAPDGTSELHRVEYDPFGLPISVAGVPILWDRALGRRLAGVGGQRFLWSGGLVHRLGDGDRWSSNVPDDPWGDDGGTGVRCGYRGELALDNLVFLGERVYDTASRCFLSRDPLPSVLGGLAFAGPYTYAANDPVNLVDPTGRRPLSDAEYQAIRTNLEKGTFEKAWDAITDDPWGALAMAGVLVVGAALCFTPLAPIGAGILIGAGLSAGVGLATGTFDPWTVAIGGVVGGVTGGVGASATTGVSTTVLVGAGATAGGSVADQVLARGRGLSEINITEVVVAGGLGGAGAGLAKYFTRGVPSTAGSTGAGSSSVIDDVLLETRTSSGNFTSQHVMQGDDALAAGMQWLGDDYVEMGKPGGGVFRSADGTRQFRIDASSIAGGHAPGIPHVHFEILAPGTNQVIVNNHVPFRN